MSETVKLLEADHRKVEALFASFEASGDEAIARQICHELEVHTQVEEEIVYPVLRDQVDSGMAEEAQHEHDEADQLITQIKTATGDELTELMGQLKTAIEHHVNEEETEVFPKMDGEAGAKMDDLGAKVAERKSELS